MSVIKEKVTVNLIYGLNARPAYIFSEEASKYISNIFIARNGNTVDAKSILGVMSLSIPKNEVIELTVDGDDAEKAFKAVSEILNSESVI